MHPLHHMFARPLLGLIALCAILFIVSGCAASTSATAGAPTTPGTSAATSTSAAISTPTISGTPAPSGTPAAASTPAPASTPPSSDQGTLEGTVLASPVCPGPQAVDAACPARPLANQAVLIEQINGSVIATVITDSTGHFRYALSSGKYMLSVRRAAPAFIGKQQTTEVTINAEQTTTVRIIIDTGIR